MLTSEDFDNHIHATGNLQTFFFYTAIEITAGGYTGKGDIYGPGLGIFGFTGTLTYGSLEELTPKENSVQMFDLGVIAGGVLIQFFIDGNQVAYLEAVGGGGGILVGDSGKLTWTKNS
jgi:hypothetical protein